MSFIEIQGVRRRFINLDCVTLIEILEDDSFKLTLPGEGQEVVDKGMRAYSVILEQILGISTCPPATKKETSERMRDLERFGEFWK